MCQVRWDGPLDGRQPRGWLVPNRRWFPLDGTLHRIWWRHSDTWTRTLWLWRPLCWLNGEHKPHYSACVTCGAHMSYPVHALPDDAGVLPCCGQPITEAKPNRLTIHPADVTCTSRALTPARLATLAHMRTRLTPVRMDPNLRP
ncbi:hypothetical protein PO878_04005 [Iamia majanohamensis]|uniref:Uncharacterized protein n=1 Tax=Iamia majanohamensis TaxID=467976 RepID=A0AAE9Y7B8_9ACTN|nr:hypothetical protein [Iamia majanohamensis]WCO67887.1 hypothetical protein PO878_04005 [Iamia majanohamensis]